VPEWWEVWLRSDGDVDGVTLLRDYAGKSEMTVAETKLVFPDRTVMLVRATIEQMSGSVGLLNCIAELRRARIDAHTFADMPAAEQIDWQQDLLRRLSPPPADAPVVCLLDTGVNNGHPLLKPAVADEDCQAYNDKWGTADHDGHGTGMAGLALYGDLATSLVSSTPMNLRHRAESVKILPPSGWPPNDPRLYGDTTRSCVAKAEINAPNRKRTICMAVTADVPASMRPSGITQSSRLKKALDPMNAHRGRGRPSSWSSAIDAMAAGVDDQQPRLVAVSAGNTEPGLRRFYPDSNIVESIHDPAQAWNALTVGACTDKVAFNTRRFPGWKQVAVSGGLAPASTTSMVRDDQWPIKPDVVFEGGNMARAPAEPDPKYIDDLQLLSTSRNFTQRPFDVMGDTSAATALAARMAAILQVDYPELRPETIRALIVHSAQWTPAMCDGPPVSQLSGEQIRSLARTCGFGVPNIERALWSARDALTLVIEDEMQPFAKIGTRLVTNEMKVHKLPWPREVLEELEAQVVELRVTLSYFIEPSPGERGRGRRYAYASHGLRFDMQTASEKKEQFTKRVSKALRPDGTQAETKADHQQWLLGPQLRHRGSIHSDRWFGTAAALAKKEHLIVSPIYGWWLDRPRLGRWNSRARYSLVVSILAPEIEVDLYTPVATEIGVPVGVVLPG